MGPNETHLYEREAAELDAVSIYSEVLRRHGDREPDESVFAWVQKLATRPRSGGAFNRAQYNATFELMTKYKLVGSDAAFELASKRVAHRFGQLNRVPYVQ